MDIRQNTNNKLHVPRQLIQQDQYNHQQLPSENMFQDLFEGVDEGKTSQTRPVSLLTFFTSVHKNMPYS